MQEISLHILDIAQNSIAAQATLVRIAVEERPEENLLRVTVADNGRGMTPAQLAAVTDPFYTTRTTRRVGLGVPLFKMAAELAGGSFHIASEQDKGTTVEVVFQLDSIDRMPLGDIGATVGLLISCNPRVDFVYRRAVGKREFTLDTREVRRILRGAPVDAPQVTQFIGAFLRENESELSSGA